MNKRNSSKVVNISSVQIISHPDALEAYYHSQTIRTYAESSAIKKAKTDEITLDFLTNSQTFNPLFVHRVAPKKLYFFAGWRLGSIIK